MDKLPAFTPVQPQSQVQQRPLPALFQQGAPALGPVYVDVYLAANLLIASPGGKMHFDTFDGIARPQFYDIVNFWFLCPRPGRYLFVTSIAIASAPAGLYTLDLYNNVTGVLLKRMITVNNPSTNPITINASARIPTLNGGEQIFLNFTNTTGGNITASGGSNSTYFGVTRESDR